MSLISITFEEYHSTITLLARKVGPYNIGYTLSLWPAI